MNTLTTACSATHQPPFLSLVRYFYILYLYFFLLIYFDSSVSYSLDLDLPEYTEYPGLDTGIVNKCSRRVTTGSFRLRWIRLVVSYIGTKHIEAEWRIYASGI